MSQHKKNPDEVAYMVEIDEDELRIRLTLVSGEKITPETFLAALSAFVDDYADCPQVLFESSSKLDYQTH